jgi:hypothetical protein
MVYASQPNRRKTHSRRATASSPPECDPPPPCPTSASSCARESGSFRSVSVDAIQATQCFACIASACAMMAVRACSSRPACARPRRDESWSASLWQTFFSTSMGAQIPVIAEKPLAVCGCRKFKIDALGDHLCTCTAHSGAKKTHDWTVDQLADLFRTTHRVKTQQVVKSRDT